jgi:hypothetical protein
VSGSNAPLIRRPRAGGSGQFSAGAEHLLAIACRSRAAGAGVPALECHELLAGRASADFFITADDQDGGHRQVRNSAPSPNNVAKPMQSVKVVRITPADEGRDRCACGAARAG